MHRYFLIAGTTAIGKSNLSSKLLSLGMAVSDLDLVRDIMKGDLQQEEILTKSFFELSIDEYKKQCELLKPAINGMINGIVKNKQHVALLGAHMIPGNECCDASNGWKKILLTMPNEELHWNQFCIRAEIDKRPFMNGKDTLKKRFIQAREYQEYLIGKAKKHGWHIIENNGDVLDCVAELLSL